MSVSAIDVQKAYLAYFGRPADYAGLNYWMNSDAATMKAGFAASAEYAALYSGMSADQRVEQVYQNLLGRASDPVGKAYWVAEFNAGRETVSSLVTSMQANVLGVDISTIANRITYSILFTAQMDTPAEINGYMGAAAAAAARGAMSAVTYTDASLSAARSTLVADVALVVAGVDPSVTPPPDPGPGPDTTAPTMISAAVAANGLSIVVTYSEALTGTAEAGDYGVTLSTGTTTVTAATIGSGADANKVTLTVSNAIGSAVTVSNLVYTATAGTANSIKDAAANSAPTQTLASVTNSSSASSYTLTVNAPIVTELMVGGATTKAMTFVLTLGSSPTEAVTVNYATQTSGTATSGTDFEAATGTVTFIAGQTVATVSIAIKTDADAEGDETVPVLFSGASLAGNVTGTGTILANDTVGLTVVLTAGVDVPVLSGNDDTINTDAPGQLTSADTVAAGAGTDTLSITTTTDTAFTLDDAIFTNVSGIDRIVILTSGTGAQTITTGAGFNGAFGAAGADLQTTSTTGAMTINMSAVTGPATLRVITTESTGGGGNSITMGAGVTTVLATSTTGPLTINAANAVVATVTATTTTGFVNVTTGAGADTVIVTTGDVAGGNVIVTGAGNDTIDVSAAVATTSGNTITGGLGADTIILTGNTSKDTIVIGNNDSGITVATADRITGFDTTKDFLKMGIAGTDNVNYVEAGSAVADFAAALTAANAALNGTVLYSFQWVTGINAAGYLFQDTGVDGIADQVVVLVGIDNAGIAFGNIIA
ncbi:MAG: DUF4214 domain-containing protein [Rhodocyclaceae bacterium]|nr:DUF4214 domain-containing protein [Rhodocyclaceae bacterium]